MGITIREIELNELDKAVSVLNHLPEFDTIFYRKKLYNRLEKSEAIILIAEFAGKPIGCKIAYNRYFDGSVYSWLGGVLPPFREQGTASLLLEKLENEARKRFFSSIRMKTRNRHIDMLRFVLKRKFQICGFELKDRLLEARIELVKKLDERE